MRRLVNIASNILFSRSLKGRSCGRCSRRFWLNQVLNLRPSSRAMCSLGNHTFRIMWRERERSPRRREFAVDQEAVVVRHMRDLLRSHPPIFDGSNSRLEAETWLIDLDRCFSMHLYGSNTKVRCTIMHLKDFASTWWSLEEQRINVDIGTMSWELFLERFRAQFLSV